MRSSSQRLVLLLLFALWMPGAATAATIVADHADDVCPVDSDPCEIGDVVKVVGGSILDFGMRGIAITNGGQFDFGAGSGTIRCGNFAADTNLAAINARGPSGDGDFASGRATVEARRLCSDASPERVCTRAQDCQLGSCGTRRCSLRPSRTCVSDANCNLGVCGSNQRCSDSPTFARCSTNADCDYGSCSSQTTCSGSGADPRSCETNEDCDLGECSVGSGNIVIDASINGYSAAPATIELRAAGSVILRENVDLTSVTGEGGRLRVTAGEGVELELVETQGALDNFGGEIEIQSGLDILLHGAMNVSGDGGWIDLEAARDVIVERSLLGNASSEGWGAEFEIDAGRDISVRSSSTLFETRLSTSGSDAGDSVLRAERDISFEVGTHLVGNGLGPYGVGAGIMLEASRDLSFDGEIDANSEGLEGEAGFLLASAFGSVSVGPEASLRFVSSGFDGLGGFIYIGSFGPMTFAGSGESVGAASSFELDAGEDLTFTGSLLVKDANAIASGGDLFLSACNVLLTPTSELQQKAAFGESQILAREQLTMLAGSKMSSESGTNRIVYRSPSKPPVLLGNIDPDAIVEENSSLPACPRCGNGEVEGSESCDDANSLGGDGCSEACVHEGCLAETAAPGFPEVALCHDGDPCTVDVCDLSSGCVHSTRTCDDGVACTEDSCSGGVCVNETDDAACADSNPCTEEVCTKDGCASLPIEGTCDDGDACTSNDHCSDGICAGEDLNVCADCGDGDTTHEEQCDDGDDAFSPGDYCNAACILVPCGHPTNAGSTLPKASDALYTLRAAVAVVSCSMRVCDVDESTKIVASDALRILRVAVGQPVVLHCPEDEQ